LQTAEQKLISLLLPEGILDYFILTRVEQNVQGLHVYLEEKNEVPDEYKKERTGPKGFMPEIAIQDFPIRGQKVSLHVKRRRWQIIGSGEIILRDWKLVHKGARMTTEFGLFLKGIFG
jgi:hypothetical protein